MARLRRNFNRTQRGLSLLEVIITVGILSVGIVMVLEALSFSAQVTGLACDIMNLVFLAEDKIQWLEFKERNGPLGEEPKEASETLRSFKWEYTLNLVPDPPLYKLDLDITSNRTKRQEILHLNTYLRQ